MNIMRLGFYHSDKPWWDSNKIIVTSLLAIMMGLPGTIFAQDDADDDAVIEEVIAKSIPNGASK